MTSVTEKDGTVRAEADEGTWGWAPLRTAWPAYVCAAALLVYAVEKGYYATQGKIGIPGGPHVPDSAYQEMHHIALRQWTLSTVGLVGALLALATVTPPGKYVPRPLMLLVLWGALVPMAAGAPYVVHDVLTRDDYSTADRVAGLVRPAVQLGIWVAMAWSYQRRSRVLKRRPR
jgi:hypothetical protein